MRAVLKSLTIRVVVVVAALSASTVDAGKIEAIPGKKYELTRLNGPVMIMIETFRRSANEGTDAKIKTAEQIANELVFELRSKNGLPAYVYRVSADDSLVDTVDRRGNKDQRKNLHKVESFGVIAGNYESLDQPLAKETLAFVKRLKPQCLSQENGITWYAKAGQGPFQKAFLTINPLLSHEEAQAKLAEMVKPDTLLIKLNSGANYSLLENKGKYTLQVALFTGRKVMEGTLAAQKTNFFEANRVNPLDEAAMQANDLAVTLRQQRGREAYVWHDHYSSIVTVGSYESKTDPQIIKDYDLFKAKPKLNEQTNVTELQPEYMWIDGKNPRENTRMWAFIPEPVLIPVPRFASKSAIARLPEAAGFGGKPLWNSAKEKPAP